MITFLQVFVPVTAAALAWWLTERSRRRWEAYKRREESYAELLTTLRGFYIGTKEPDALKLRFLDQLARCWLYAPDDVIRKGYNLMNAAGGGGGARNTRRRQVAGVLVVAIRNDLRSQDCRDPLWCWRCLIGDHVKPTGLTAADFRLLGVPPEEVVLEVEHEKRPTPAPGF